MNADQRGTGVGFAKSQLPMANGQELVFRWHQGCKGGNVAPRKDTVYRCEQPCCLLYRRFGQGAFGVSAPGVPVKIWPLALSLWPLAFCSSFWDYVSCVAQPPPAVL